MIGRLAIKIPSTTKTKFNPIILSINDEYQTLVNATDFNSKRMSILIRTIRFM